MKSDYAKSASRTLAVSLLLAALLVAGCGGGEQSSQEEQGSQEETTTAPSTTAGEDTTAPSGESTNAQGGNATAQVVAATEAWLATLDDAQREQVSFGFGDQDAKANWSNLPGGIFERNGARFGDMTPEQQQAAMAMLQAALSEEGYEQTVGTMVSDQVLANEVGGGDVQLGIDEYYVAIFGTPSETEPWMLQYGGHHYAINLTVSGQDNILTPSFAGVQPSEVTLDEAGDLPAFVPVDVLGTGTVRPMADENDLAFELINALDPQQQEGAILDYEVTDLVLGPDENVRVLEPEGLPASGMTPNQQALLLDVVREWAGIVNEEATEARMSEIEANLDESYFAWSGPTENGQPIYYRITGPTLHVEFVHREAPPPGGILHIHSVYRDPTNDYGEQSVGG